MRLHVGNCIVGHISVDSTVFSAPIHLKSESGFPPNSFKEHENDQINLVK